MTEMLIAFLVGIAALVAAFFNGKKTQKKLTKLKEAEDTIDVLKKSKDIEESVINESHDSLRKWMRDNSTK
jgi:hypothetical protein